MLRTDMEANMKTLRADNEVALTKHEAAIGRFQASNEKAIGGFQSSNEKAIGELRTDFEKLRTTIEKNSKTLIFQTIGVVTAVATITGLLIKVFGS